MITTPQREPGVTTSEPPATTVNGSNYVLAWTTSDQAIWWTTCPASANQKSYDWAKEAQFINAASSGGPALASFKNTAYLAWKGEAADTRIFVASLDGTNWSAPTPIAGIGTSAAPALASDGSALFLVWKGEHDDTLYVAKSSDGKSWGASAVISGASSSDTPALAAYQSGLALAFKGASDDAVYLAEYTDAKGWGKAVKLNDVLTSCGPALAFGNTGNLHLVTKGHVDDFLWESVRNAGSSNFSPQAKIVGVGTDVRPALASQPSAATDILFAWKNGTTSGLLIAPLDGLHRLYPTATPVVTATTLTWGVPKTGFGSGASGAAFDASLTISSDGKATFSGAYWDYGSIPVFDAPAQDYTAVIAVLGANKVGFTFTHSKNDVATGGTEDTWNTTATNDAIAKNWQYLQPRPGVGVPQAVVRVSCSNNSDLGAFLDEVISDLEALVGDVETAVQWVSVIAAAV